MDTGTSPDASTSVAKERFSDSRLLLPIYAYAALAIVAGAIFFGIYKKAFPVYDVPEHLLRSFPTDEDAVKREICKRFAKTVHASLSMGILGLALSLLFGLGEGAKRGFQGGSFVRILLGSILAAAIGCLGGWLSAQVFFQLEKLSFLESMSRTFIAQAIMFSMMGIGVGATVGIAIGTKRMIKACAGAGALAAAAAAAGFLIVTAFALPSVQSDSLIPDGSAGVFGCVTEAGTIGVATWTACIVLGVCLMRPIVNRGRNAPRATAAASSVAAT